METSENKLYIIGLTPPTVERGLLWFQDNKARIEKEIATPTSWWSKHSTVIESMQHLERSAFLRSLSDLGYQKESQIMAPGEFRVLGGVVDIFPINTKTAYRIEFAGNTIESIGELKDIENTQPSVPIQKIITYREHRSSTETMEPGMYVVHIDHGIGKLRAIEHRTFAKAGPGPAFAGEKEEEYFVLEYAGGDVLYVPKHLTNKVSPYVGFGSPTVYRLGGNLWERVKRKAKEDLIQTAKELARIYAERDQVVRAAYTEERDQLQSLAESFPYDETPDQKKAIASVMRDMGRERPMDRLVCGDVGFGKTEIAIRAVARAAFSGRQTAILAPTTILAWQHFNTFKNRLEKFPVRIATLSRIQTKSEQKEIVEKLATGEIDIVIGTHRLLSKDVHFKNLGLLVIDEEQRFGVHQKETFKKIRAHVDVLSLSATPIPRTLSFSLAGIRDISVIHTPPIGRLPIKTVVAPYKKETVKDALEKELARGGQVYILHNRVATIYKAQKEIQKLVPNARVVVAHAKLPEKELISTIDSFTQGEIDILVATTIIENGLDVQNVNTLIIDDASRLGLAQAHQIRGRIGRGDRQAYAYLLHPRKIVQEAVRERLDTLHAMQYLGAGYQIALKDLEMRGAGNFLGRDQSGTVNKIGFNLYCQMLQEAIEDLQSK